MKNKIVCFLTGLVCLLTVGLTGCRDSSPAEVTSTPSDGATVTSSLDAAEKDRREERGTKAVNALLFAMEQELTPEEIAAEYAGCYFDQEMQARIGIVGEENLEKYRALLSDELRDDVLFETWEFPEQQLQEVCDRFAELEFGKLGIARVSLMIQKNCVEVVVKSEEQQQRVEDYMAREMADVNPHIVQFVVDPDFAVYLE